MITFFFLFICDDENKTWWLSVLGGVIDLFLLNFQSRARQEDPEQARLKQKAKEVRFLPADVETSNITSIADAGGGSLALAC